MSCRWQNSIRSGTRAMVPSSFMISQMMPAGISPASRARSTEASVCPARTSTPPLRARRGIDGHLNGARAIEGGDARGHARARVNRLSECGAVLRSVLGAHGTDAQVVEALLGHGEADQAASILGHEVDGFGSDLLGGERDVAFVLAVFVVDDDNHAAGADLLDGSGDVGKGLRAHDDCIVANGVYELVNKY